MIVCQHIIGRLFLARHINLRDIQLHRSRLFAMVYELQAQPFKSLYVAYQQVTTYLIRIPCWTLRYAFASLRPRPTWTYRMSMVVPRARLWSTFGDVAK